MSRKCASLLAALLASPAIGCGSDDDDGPPAGADAGRDAAPTPADAGEEGEDAGTVGADELEVRFLGVAGFLLRTGGDAVLTAPMFSNPDLGAVTVGQVASDPALVDRFTAGVDFSDVRAIVTGHAHYDHLMDVPTVWRKTAGVPIIGNETMRHILAAFAPERDASCADTPAPAFPIPRDAAIALDDPTDDRVDERPCGGPDASAGSWTDVAGAPVRVRAFCSSHPAQFLFIHFGEGSWDEDLCTPPTSASDWKEGRTISMLIDFLDPDTGAPRFRVYYQDAPTDAPVGHPPPDVLSDKAVDLALLCVGNFDQVRDQPTEIIEALQPRYVVSGHWESFFQTQDQPLVSLPNHDLDLYTSRAEAALVGPEAPAIVDGVAQQARHWMPNPGTTFRFPAE